MVATNWTYADAKPHFFIYVERVGTADMLHELRGAPISAHPDVDRIATTLFQNLRATALATSAPYFTALLGAHTGRSASVKELMERARAERDRGALEAALHVLQDSGAFIDHSFETLQLVHTRGVMPEAFQALLNQSTAMVWGSFESYCYDLFRLLFTTDLNLLRSVVGAFGPKTAWGAHPRKLLEHIEAQLRATPPISAPDAFDAYKNLPSLNINAMRFFSRVLFSADTALQTVVHDDELSKLAARRHLILHAAGVVDQNYNDTSTENLPVGSTLAVTPRELALAFRAVSSAAGALAAAATAVL